MREPWSMQRASDCEWTRPSRLRLEKEAGSKAGPSSKAKETPVGAIARKEKDRAVVSRSYHS